MLEKLNQVMAYTLVFIVLWRAMTYLILALAISAEVVGTTFLKLSDGFTKFWPSVVTALSYGASFYFLSIALRSIPTGIAYAIWSGAGLLLITMIAWVFQGQKLDAPAIGGMALILAGLVVMNVWSDSAPH